MGGVDSCEEDSVVREGLLSSIVLSSGVFSSVNDVVWSEF